MPARAFAPDRKTDAAPSIPEPPSPGKFTAGPHRRGHQRVHIAFFPAAGDPGRKGPRSAVARAGAIRLGYLRGQVFVHGHVIEGAETVLQVAQDLLKSPPTLVRLAAGKDPSEEVGRIAELLDRNAQPVPASRVEVVELPGPARDFLVSPFQFVHRQSADQPAAVEAASGSSARVQSPASIHTIVSS